MDERARQVIDPLCPETEGQFKELTLQRNDRLVVWLDKTGEKLLAKVEALVPLQDESRLEETGCDGKRWERWGRPSFYARDFFLRVPETGIVDNRARDPAMVDVRWMAATDYTALLIKCLWPEDRVVYRTDHARVLVEYLYLRFQRQAKFSEAVARFKLLKQQPELPERFQDAWHEHHDPSLRLADYQRAVCIASIGMEACAYFMEAGTGKTAPSIQRVCVEGTAHRRATGKMYRALVVCPPQVRLNWQLEFRRFATTPGKVTVVRGGKIKRVSLLTEAIAHEEGCDYSVAIIGYDSFVESIEPFKMVPWDIVIFDESHKFKSHSTQRFHKCAEIREVGRQRQILTGTPIGNSLMDLFAQFEVMGKGLSGFATWQGYKRFHGVWEATDSGATGVERLVGARNVPMLQERLARLSFMITKAEAGLKLPEKVYSTIEVEMTPRQADAYKQLSEQLALEIEDALSNQTNQLVVENVLTKLLRLAHVTSGFVSFPEVRSDDGALVRERFVQQIPGGNPKIDALVELLTDEGRPRTSKAVVWACWREDIHRISERLASEGIEHALYYGSTPMSERDGIVHRFNHDPALRVLVCNADTAGEGLNLVGYCVDSSCPQHATSQTTRCDMAVFFSQTWSSLARSQAEDRTHRRGTRSSVQVVDMVVPGSIDEEIRSRVLEKREMARTVTDVREVLSNVLGVLRGAAA